MVIFFVRRCHLMRDFFLFKNLVLGGYVEIRVDYSPRLTPDQNFTPSRAAAHYPQGQPALNPRTSRYATIPMILIRSLLHLGCFQCVATVVVPFQLDCSKFLLVVRGSFESASREQDLPRAGSWPPTPFQPPPSASLHRLLADSLGKTELLQILLLGRLREHPE